MLYLTYFTLGYNYYLGVTIYFRHKGPLMRSLDANIVGPDPRRTRELNKGHDNLLKKGWVGWLKFLVRYMKCYTKTLVQISLQSMQTVLKYSNAAWIRI